MSSAVAPPPPTTTSTKSPSITGKIIVGDIGYAIAVALGFLVLFSSAVITSYICYGFIASRRRRRRAENRIRSFNPSGGAGGLQLQTVIRMAENDPRNDVAAVAAGLEERAIDSYPKFVYTTTKGGEEVGGEEWRNDVVCVICLSEYREQDVLRMLPDCTHCFHAPCVDAWLKLNASCPVCRSSPLPSANSTPLQPVVMVPDL